MKKVTTITFALALLLIASSLVAAQGFSGIGVSLLRYSPQPVQPGQVMDVYLQVANSGDPTIDTSLELIEEYPFTIESSQDKERGKNLGSVSSTQTLHYRVRVAEDAKDGLATLRARYQANSGDRGDVEKEFDIDIQTFDARLDIINIEQYPEEIEPGKPGKLTITLQNNDDKPLQNIDVVLDLTNSYDVNTNMDNMLAMQAMVNARLEEVNRRVASGQSPLKGATPMMNGASGTNGMGQTTFDEIAPVGISNQKSISLIEGNEQAQVTFDIMPLPNIEPNIYAVPLYVNYNDEDNNPFHVRVDAPVRVNMEPELYVTIESTTLRTTDFAGEVVFTVANRGLSTLRYVTLELQDDNTIELLTAPRSIYLGDLKPGESKNGKFTIIAHEEDITLLSRVAYRDSFNEAHSDLRPLPFKIINRNYYRDLPYEMSLVWLILGAVILALTIFYVWHIKKAHTNSED
ncbi:MAG: COG1361 S-layer family protein [Candidatus Nanoarchaeia archaeon]